MCTQWLLNVPKASPLRVSAEGMSIFSWATIDIRQFFDQSLSFMQDARTNGKRVLIHCQMGMSRSATLVILWLMQKRKWTLQKASAWA